MKKDMDNLTFRIIILCVTTAVLLMMIIGAVFAHDKHYAINSDMKHWFEGLRSGKGPCCADADGNVITDADWESINGHYRVRLEGQWIDVPDDAVIKEPNMYGPTIVWPINIWGANGKNTPMIRCFLPGALM
jgi:hypothetical protein